MTGAEPLLQQLELPASRFSQAFVRWGAGDDACPVVCVHGLTRNSRDFDSLAAALADRGRTVIALDVAGRGRSGWLSSQGQYSTETYLIHVEECLALLGYGRVDWIGTSMGGLIGMALASARPALIRSLILNDIGPLVPAAALKQIAGYVGEDPVFADLSAAEAYLRRVHAGFGMLAEWQWQHLARHSVRRDQAGRLRLHYDPAIGQAFKAIEGDIDLWPLWRKLSCPRFMLRGAASNVLLPGTFATCLADPSTEGAVFAGCGHAPALMDGDQIATILTWLERIG